MITNGFDITPVLNALRTRIGWQQPFDSSFNVSDENKQSDSGRYFQQFHPLLTIQNIRAVMEDERLNDENFNKALVDMRDGVILSVLNAVFNRPQQLESTLIYDRLRRNDNPTNNAGKFAGFRFWVAPSSYAVQISQVSFLFNGDCSFKLYLYNDAIRLPLYSTDVTITGDSETIVPLKDWIMRYIDVTNKVQGGVFYLGYYQNDLPADVVAYEEFVTRWNPSRIFGYSAFEIPQSASGTTPDFTRLSIPYTYRTYGMNAELQSYRDYTNFTLKNTHLFDELIGLSMAVIGLGYMNYTTRTNFLQRVTKEMAQSIYNEVNNAGPSMMSPYVAGLKKQLEREISRVQDAVFHDPSKHNEFTTTRPTEWELTNNPMLRV